MRSAAFFQRIHDRSPKLGKALSLATATGVILGNSFAGSLPVWFMGATKMITGSAVADKAVIKIANHWINSNNRVIDTVLPKKDWRIHLPDSVRSDGKYLLVSNHQSWVDTSVVQYSHLTTKMLQNKLTKRLPV